MSTDQAETPAARGDHVTGKTREALIRAAHIAFLAACAAVAVLNVAVAVARFTAGEAALGAYAVVSAALSVGGAVAGGLALRNRARLARAAQDDQDQAEGAL